MSDEQQSFIKSPRQLIVVVLLAFVVPIIVITLFATLVSTTTRTGAGTEAMSDQAIAQRLQPVGRVELADAAGGAAQSAPAAAAPASGAAPAAGGAAAAAPAAKPAAAAAAPQQAGASAEGEKIYKGTCSVCHETGVAGAPKHGDKAAWKPRLEQGNDVLVKHAIEGIRAMPPRGGNGSLSDEQVRASLEYMLAPVR